MNGDNFFTPAKGYGLYGILKERSIPTSPSRALGNSVRLVRIEEITLERGIGSGRFFKISSKMAVSCSDGFEERKRDA